MRNRRNKRKSPKRDNILKILTGLCIFVGLISFSVIFSMINMSNSNIIRGVRVEGINISGLSQEEAAEKIRQWYNETVMKNISLKFEDLHEEINVQELEAEENIDKIIRQAMSIGRSGNIVKDNYEILFTMIFKKNFEIAVELNEEKVDKKIQEIGGKLPDAVIQSSYYIEDEELIIKTGKDGITTKKQELKDAIKEIIKQKDKTIQIPVEKVQIEQIDISKIHDEIYKEPKDAYIEEETDKFHAHVNGIDFKISIDEANKILEEPKEEYVIPLKIVTPKVTTEMLGAKAFPDLLAEFTTRYDGSDENKGTNIKLAAEKINGTVIMPGETFSYNRIVGERTIAKGYKEAPVYMGGKVVLGIGGGICQVSSTLYNAVLYANLEITSRTNHRFLPSYIKAGRDATVSWGTLDFCFKNTRTYPVKITAIGANGIAKIQIYGVEEENEYEVELETNIFEEKEYKTTYINDSKLEKGQEVLEQIGANGIKCETYKIVKQEGKEVSRTLISTDTYSPLEEVIKKGR